MAVHVVRGAPGPLDAPGNPAPGQQPSTPVYDAPAANTAAVVTIAAVAGQRHRITGLGYSYSASPTGGNLLITDGGTTIVDIDVTSSWEVWAMLPPGGIECGTNSAVVVTLAAGGAGISGKVNVAYLTA